MSFDIIKEAACREFVVATNNLTGAATCLSTRSVCLTPNTAHCVHCWYAMESEIVADHCLSNVVCVFNSSNFVGGRCCAWTVPSGAVKAHFQIWGSGAPGGGGNCCGGGLWGSTGTYLAFTIPVTPGCVYTLCAACSLNCVGICCCGQGAIPQSPISSFVCGFGICNAIAPGGYQDLVQNMCARLCRIGSLGVTPCRFQNECCWNSNGCGPCICSCVSLCNSSQPVFGAAPVPDWDVWSCIPCITTGLCQYTPIHRLPMFHGGAALNTSNGGVYLYMPPFPVGGFAYTQCTATGTACCNVGGFFGENVSDSTCIGPGMSLTTASLCMPVAGMGGAYSHAMAGCISVCGGQGRGGFVKVVWATSDSLSGG